MICIHINELQIATSNSGSTGLAVVRFNLKLNIFSQLSSGFGETRNKVVKIYCNFKYKTELAYVPLNRDGRMGWINS